MINANLDQYEVDKFNQLARQWWDKDGMCKPLHDINPLRVNYIESKVKLAGMNILDVGCGGGILTEALALSGAHLTGIDMAQEVLDCAHWHAQSQQLIIHYETTTAEQFAQYHPHSYDIVCCMELLEHVPQPEQLIAACARLVKPGGHLFFSTLNRTVKSYLFSIIGAEYLLKLLPRGTHDYAKFIQPAELAQWCRHAKLNLKECRGMSYNPLRRIYTLSDDIEVNYLVHCQLLEA